VKIALLSYEYPPDTAVGGIATYVYQLAHLLHRRGHHVEVFAGSGDRCGTEIEAGVLVHRVKGENNALFSKHIGDVFANRHQLIHFDVLEAPEIAANARGAIQQVPELPLVIKLHTPTFLIHQINDLQPSWTQKLRWHLGAIRQGKWPKPFPKWHYDVDQDIERSHTLDADEITTPSKALGDQLIQLWNLPSHKVTHLANPYIPSPELLNIPIETSTNVVTFVGRLEIRKGILDLATAIPMILRQYPNVTFRFVGAAWTSPEPRLNMQQYLEKKLHRYRHALAFTGAVALDRIPLFLADTDICVFPSRWENFPTVCLEAMAAGRGIIGSRAGGMAEMLDNSTGRLISPRCPTEIATATLELLQNPTLRMQLGQAARDRVLAEYNQDRIGMLQEASYKRAIASRKALGVRAS